jgi:hypothetical protein
MHRGTNFVRVDQYQFVPSQQKLRLLLVGFTKEQRIFDEAAV